MRLAGAVGTIGALLFIAVVAACSSDDPPASPPDVPDGGPTPTDSGGGGTDAAEGGAIVPGEPRRGSRLAPRFRTTADGLDQHYGIVDTQLGNAGCYSSRASDGAMRCLPTEYVFATGELFADAACTTLAAELRSSCAKPLFAARSVDGTAPCDARSAIHDVGAVAGEVFRKEGAACVSAASTPGMTYYVVGAERPPTDFVKLTRTTDVIAGGLGADAVDGDDGSHFPQFAIVDVARSSACEAATTSDGQQRCVPAGAANVYGFTDADCMNPAAHTSMMCDALYETNTARMTDPANSDHTRIYTLGAERPNRDLYSKIDATTCDGPGVAGDVIHDLGPEIPAAMFPAISYETVGGTRIVGRRPAAAGKTLPRWDALQDLELDVRCSVVQASDGKQRCVPQGTPITYSDALCTQRIVVVVSAQTAPKYAVETDRGCPQTYRVFPVAAEITPPPAMTYQSFSGTCTGEAVSDQAKVYGVGAEVAASSFVEVTHVIR